MDARKTWLLKDIAKVVREDISEVRPFTAPAITARDAELLRDARNGDYASFGDLPHVPMDVLVATFREAGWTLRNIGDALGVTRQYIHARYIDRGKGPSPNDEVLAAITKRVEPGPFSPVSVPRYAIDPDDPDAHVPIGIVPDEDILTLSELLDEHRGDPTPENRRAVVDFARSLTEKYKVTYTQLSIAAGSPTRKWSISRMAVHEGEDVYVPGMRPRRRAS